MRRFEAYCCLIVGVAEFFLKNVFERVLLCCWKVVPLHSNNEKFKLNICMATKIRLQRHGRKGYAFYPIVIADSRAPRDGKFIERIGSYNPNTNPATISLDFDRALYWVEVGAVPTDTVRSILSKEGVMLMKHLNGGVKKGAFDQAEAERRFNAWKEAHNKGEEAAKAKLNAKAAEDAKARFEAEVEKNRVKGEAVAKKKAEKLAAEEAAAKAALEAENAAKEAEAEAPAAE